MGTKFLNKVAELYVNQNYDFSIITSAKNLISTLRKSDKWCMYDYTKSKPESQTSSVGHKVRDNCYTARFMYKR